MIVGNEISDEVANTAVSFTALEHIRLPAESYYPDVAYRVAYPVGQPGWIEVGLEAQRISNP